ncbi:MAG: DnaJ family domain-containing protein [Anaerolineales bacterium]
MTRVDHDQAPLEQPEREEKSMRDLVEERIEKAMERGEFDNLPGAGKPLHLENDRNVPPEMRLAYRIMRDNDVLPEWMALQQEINTRLENARKGLRRVARQFHHIMTQFEGRTDIEGVTQRLAARDQRDYALDMFRDQVRVINKRIQLYNLKVPFSHLTRDLVDAEREIAKFF